MKIVRGCVLFVISTFIFVKETVSIDENERDNRCERMSTTEKVAGETKYNKAIVFESHQNRCPKR